VLCGMGGVGTRGSAIVCYVYVNIVGSVVSSYVCRDYTYPIHLLPPHCIQPIQVEYICLLNIFISQSEDGQ